MGLLFYTPTFRIKLGEKRYMEGIDNIPTEAMLNRGTPDLVKRITDFEDPISKITLWLLGWRVTRDGTFEKDDGKVPVMNEQGADGYTAFLKAITASPISLTKREFNEVAMMNITNVSTICKMLISNEENWNLMFDEYADALVDIVDILGTAASSGSIDGFTISKLTENLQINEMRGQRSNEKRGLGLPNLFRRNKSE